MDNIICEASRKSEKSDIEKWVANAHAENPINAFIGAFYVRDCRGGKGERKAGKRMFVELRRLDPTNFNKIAHHIPFYGRFDDLIRIIKHGPELMQIINAQLLVDITDMESRKKISLLGKWLPTEKCNLDRKYGFVNNFCDYTNFTKKEYRKTVSSLRKYLNIIERLMCEKKWGEIQYPQVPAKCMFKLKKAFEKHDSERFRKYKQDLSEGKVKVCGNTLYPHEILMAICKAKEEDIILEKQWEEIVKETVSKGKLENSICICDVSGSMGGIEDPAFQPIHASVAMSILISQCCQGDFSQQIITFSEKPEFVDLTKFSTIREKIYNLSRAAWGGSTNLQGVFDLLLSTAKMLNTPQEFLPTRLFIFSDMAFDCASGRGVSLAKIREKYSEAGFKIPQIIFWNLSGKVQNSPCETNEEGVLKISGFSPVILKILMENGCVSTDLFIKSIVDSPRYVRIIDSLAN
jgi:hypothetical protein